jgi:hypothetical protein
MELAKSAFACTAICFLIFDIFSDLEFHYSASLEMVDSKHVGTVYANFLN